MISRMLSASRRVLCSTTSTSGFSAWIESRGRLRLRHPDPLGVVDHLALEVGLVDHVVVDDPQGPNSGRREIEGGRRAQPSGADQEHLRVQQLELALDPDLGQHGVSRVAHPLLGLEALGGDHRQSLLGPCLDSARDRGHVLVAELVLQEVGGARRAVARRAVDDHPRGPVRHQLGDPLADGGRRHQVGSLEVGLVPLVRLAGVDEDHVAALDLLLGAQWIDLIDPALDQLDWLRDGCHQPYSPESRLDFKTLQSIATDAIAYAA